MRKRERVRGEECVFVFVHIYACAYVCIYVGILKGKKGAGNRGREGYKEVVKR